MAATTFPALGSGKRIILCIPLLLLILPSNVVQACIPSWPCPWPDSSNLPAGASQYGNVFPGGNLWDGSTLYSPANLPQRYLVWTFESPYNGYPNLYGAMDPGKATYRDASGTLIVGSDLYNLYGLDISQSNSIPTSASDPRWDRWRNGIVQGYFHEGMCGNPGAALEFGQDVLIVLQIDNTGNHCPDPEKHAWISFRYCNVAVEGDSPMVIAFGAGTVVDGWYHLPANPEALQWGWYGFALTITNGGDNVSFAVGDLDSENLYIDDLQIACVCIPEPVTWRLVALGAPALVVLRRLPRATRRT
jgi:hypothetical protein